MKELSIEEKAKRYDEALKEAVITHKDEDRHLKATLERIFPELKESGNIRIIKAIKYGLDHVFTNNTTVFEVTKEQCLAWLEKQGEQKPAWSEEDEAKLKSILFHIEDVENKDVIDWLKSLRPQNRWKPSGFYLECISDAIAIYEERGINAIGLKEILEELKKLRDE